jgi:hypothetical protein
VTACMGKRVVVLVERSRSKVEWLATSKLALEACVASVPSAARTDRGDMRRRSTL